MARQLDSKCRLCRRAGEKLFLKGDRCTTPKCAMVRKPYPPGMHGKKGVRNLSEYGRQLAMKQRIKRIYGVLEKQFRNHFEEIQNKKGVTGDLLIERLESRFDNVLYRSGLASSRAQARQLINHGLFTVNGKKMDIPSSKISQRDVIAVKKEKAEKKYFQLIKESLKAKKDVPTWLELDSEKYTCTVSGLPSADTIDASVDPQMVVEFYSK